MGIVILNNLNENEKNIIKETAFKHGLPLNQITTIFSILLRDKILEKKGKSLQPKNN